jgi:hypothetical protein
MKQCGEWLIARHDGPSHQTRIDGSLEEQYSNNKAPGMTGMLEKRERKKKSGRMHLPDRVELPYAHPSQHSQE